MHTDKNHQWHLEQLSALCADDPALFLATAYKIVTLADPVSFNDAVDWWTGMTQKGGEGMVVKPYDFSAFGTEGLLQPAVKCRGSEYLRIIYCPEYDLPHNLERLKNRGLSRKRSLALREFALGVEGLERFVKKSLSARCMNVCLACWH